MKTPILIVGAGPTGLTLACELARRNVPFRIIERAATYPQGSRAKGLQPRTMEVFNDLGIADEIMEAGTTDIIFRRFDGSQLIDEIRRSVFPRDDTRYTHAPLIPQWKVEAILRKKLSEYGINVELASELVDLTQEKNEVFVSLKNSTGVEKSTFTYVVACDGGKSTVRKIVGVNFVGETHEDERALVGDVEVEGLTPDAWHMWVHPQLGFGFALCPFKGTNSWQLQAVVIPDEDGNLPEPTLENFNRLFKERTGMSHVTLKNCTWGSVYRVNVRMADKFRSGNVFIAGDAAHAHSIAGGLGMNTGIQDAYNLGWKLASVIKGRSSDTLLNTYQEERLPVAAWTLNISSERQAAMMDSLKDGSNKIGLDKIATKDTTQLNLNYRYSSLSLDLVNKSEILKAGDRAPDAKLPNGSWLSDIYRGPHFTVLAFGIAAQVTDRINHQFSETAKAFVINDENAVKTFGNTAGFFIIRPDGYIGMIAGIADEAAVLKYLSNF